MSIEERVVLQKGDPAPEFALKDETGKTWSSDELRGKRVVLFFYPADDTPGCTRESCDFRDSYEDFEQADYVVLGVSPQDETSHRAFKSKYSLNFPLLVDGDGDVAQRYGAAGSFGDYKGIPLRVKRATFVIDEDGKLAEVEYGVRSKGHVERLRATLGI